MAAAVACSRTMAAAESVHASPPPGPSESPEAHAGQLRIAMIGNVDSGKSTLTGCLTRGVTDDGRGAARAHVRPAPGAWRVPTELSLPRAMRRSSGTATRLRTGEHPVWELKSWCVD